MRPLFYISILAFCFVSALCMLPRQLHAQQNVLELFPDRKKEWKRLSTDADSTTDVSVGSLVFEPNGIFRATFRIQLGKPEKAPEKPDAKYKTRVMTFQFDYRKTSYRIFETTLLDSSEKVVFTSGQLVDAPWKSGLPPSFFQAASRLSPLGRWAVTSSSEADTPDIVTSVTTRLDRFEVGRKICSAPEYESVSMTREELAKVAGLWATRVVEMSDEKVNAVKIKCASPTSEIHLLIPKSLDGAILLSGGALYALARQVDN